MSYTYDDIFNSMSLQDRMRIDANISIVLNNGSMKGVPDSVLIESAKVDYATLSCKAQKSSNAIIELIRRFEAK